MPDGDLSGVSTEDLEAFVAGDMTKVSTAGLERIVGGSPAAPPAPAAPNFVRRGGPGIAPKDVQFQNVPKPANWLRDSPMVGPTVRMGEVAYHGIADPIVGAVDAASANYERDWRTEEFRKNHPELANQPSMSAPSSGMDLAGIVGKGTFGTAMGVAQVAEPWMLPLVASQAAAQKQAEDEATMQGASPALGVAAAPAKALEWWAQENAAPFAEKAGVVAQDITGSPTVAKGVEGATDFAANMVPFSLAGAGRQAVGSIGKPAPVRPTMPPLERVPVPEQIPGTPVGRLRGARPAPVVEPTAPVARLRKPTPVPEPAPVAPPAPEAPVPAPPAPVAEVPVAPRPAPAPEPIPAPVVEAPKPVVPEPAPPAAVAPAPVAEAPAPVVKGRLRKSKPVEAVELVAEVAPPPAVQPKPASLELPPPAEPVPTPGPPAPAKSPAIPESSPHRAFIDRFVQAVRDGKTEDAAAEYRAMPPAERTKVHETLVADGLWQRGDGFSLPAIKAHADRVVAAEKAAAPAPMSGKGVGKKLRRGGKQSGEIINPVAAGEGVYDAADAGAGKLLRSAASAVRENVPGVDKVATAAEGVRDKWFKSDAANVGDEYLAVKGERKGQEGLGVEHAGRAVRAVDKALHKASPEDIEGANRYLSSQSNELPASLAHKKSLFDAVAREIKDLGAQLVERGLMSKEAFDQYARYLPRLYEAKGKLFGFGGDAPRIRESFLREDAPGFKFKHTDYAIIEETARKHGGYAFTEKNGTRAVKFPSVEARDAAYAEVSEAFRGQKSRLNQQATGEIRKGEVGQAKMLHRDSLETPSASRMIEKFDALTPEVLKELGEITDPRAPIQQAIQNAHAKIAADTFFKAVAEGSDAKGPWAVELPRDGYTHIDAQWAGKLRGKYLRNDILPDIQGDFNAEKAGFARGWINQWKANKTVWSPRTAARQWLGNPFFLHLAGVDPMNPANWKAIKKAATALHPDSPLRRELVRERVIGPHDFAHIELPTDRAPNMAYRLGQAAANPLMLFRFGRNSQMRMGKVYGSADLVARASIYYRNIERGMSPRQAAAEVRKWTPNYDEVGRATKLLKNSVIGSPFATYSHETIRIVGQALKDHPVRLGTGLLTLAAVQKAFDMAGADDVTEDERKAIEQQRGSQEIVIGRDDEGRPLTFGAQYINPIGSLAPKASRLGDDKLTRAASYVGDATGIAQSPLVDTIATVARGEDRYGRKTAPRAATGYERVMGALEAYGRQVAPGLTPGLGGNYAQVEAAAKDEQLSDRIPKQTLEQAIVSAILGIDVRPFDVGLEKRNLTKQTEGRISGIKSDMTSALRESKGEDKDAAPDAVKKLKDTVQDFKGRAGVLRKASPPKKDTLPTAPGAK